MKNKSVVENLVRFKNSREWIEFKNYCETGLMEQIGLFRYEDVHTNFLSNLLKLDNVYGLGTKPLKLFLELLKLKSKDKKMDYIDISDNYDITCLSTETQKNLNCGRLDLTIRFKINNEKYVIILENKLLSEEGKNQTKNYQQEIENTVSEYFEGIRIYVFLSQEKNPKLSADEDETTNVDWIKITYQDLITYVLEPCSYLEVNNASLSISEYLKSFTYLCKDHDENFMPITESCKQLALSLYDKYNEILNDILNNIPEGNRKKIEKDGYIYKFYKYNINTFRILYEVLLRSDINNKTMCDTIKRKIFGYIGIFKKEEYKTNVDLFYAILKDMIMETKVLRNLSDLNKVWFAPRSTWKVAITQEQYNDNIDRQGYYKNSNKLELEGKPLYHCNSIYTEDIKGFVKCVKENKWYDDENLELYIDM